MHYDQRPKDTLDANGNGRVIIFSEGYKIVYLVGNWINVKFLGDDSGRCDGGRDGAYNVPNKLVKEGHKCAREIIKAIEIKKKVRLQ